MTNYETQIEALASLISEMADEYVEYQTEHADALDGYSHLPGEGDWDYHNNDDRVAERARALGLEVPEGEEDTLGAACIERLSWRFEHMFCNDADVLGSFPIQEIEHHIDLGRLDAWCSLVADASLTKRKAIFYDVGERCGFDHFSFSPAHDDIFIRSTTDVAAVYALSDQALRAAHADAFSL